MSTFPGLNLVQSILSCLSALKNFHVNLSLAKELRACKNCFSPICSYGFIRKITKVLKSLINLTFTVAMVTKMAAEIG